MATSIIENWNFLADFMIFLSASKKIRETIKDME